MIRRVTAGDFDSFFDSADLRDGWKSAEFKKLRAIHDPRYWVDRAVRAILGAGCTRCTFCTVQCAPHGITLSLIS